MGAFSDRVRDRSAEVVQVRIAKELSIDDRRRELSDARKTFLLMHYPQLIFYRRCWPDQA
jgi:hypothetical protein